MHRHSRTGSTYDGLQKCENAYTIRLYGRRIQGEIQVRAGWKVLQPEVFQVAKYSSHQNYFSIEESPRKRLKFICLTIGAIIFSTFEFSALFYLLKLCFIVICFTKWYQKFDFLMLQYRCLTTPFAVSVIITGLQLLDVCDHIHGYSLLPENVFDMPDAV